MARVKSKPTFYVLRGRAVEACADVAEWVRRKLVHVAFTQIDSDVVVSTIFVGADMAGDGREPLMFETKVFGGECDGDAMRAGSWGIAETQHSVMCARVRTLLRCSEGAALVE